MKPWMPFWMAHKEPKHKDKKVWKGQNILYDNFCNRSSAAGVHFVRPSDEQWLRWTYCLGKVRASEILCWDTETGAGPYVNPHNLSRWGRGKQAGTRGGYIETESWRANEPLEENYGIKLPVITSWVCKLIQLASCLYFLKISNPAGSAAGCRARGEKDAPNRLLFLSGFVYLITAACGNQLQPRKLAWQTQTHCP